MAVGFLFLPFWYVKLTANHYKRDVSAELETALSVITTAYLRTEDIVTAVEENIAYLNPPVSRVFQDFLIQIKMVNPDVQAALRILRGRIDNEVFREWCDAVSDCQHDRSLKTTLPPIVSKLSDMRNVNAELEYMIAEPRKEFMIMVVFVVGNIPLMYLLNQDWYDVLMHTVLGQCILAATAAAIFISAGFVVKLTRPYFMILAVRLSGFIRMDAYKRSRMQNVLKASGMNMTPEVYQAYALVKSGAVLLGAIPCMFLFPLLVPVVVVLALLLYFKENQKADETLKAKREEIEGELPRMVATMEQELKASRNVIGMLERFKGNAGPALTGELDILLADMRSSNYEAALTRFEARLNSPMLSDVVRGLIGVLRGDDSTVYFQMLAHDFKQIELQRLKAQAQKIPPKIRVFSFVMLVCFLLTYLAIICYVALESLGGMF